MKIAVIDPPRVFEVGFAHKIQLRDSARILLEPDEQVTFVTESGAEYDIARKVWGYYATPSLDGRLASFGLRGALVKSAVGRHYILLVERHLESMFGPYLDENGMTLLCWLDTQPHCWSDTPEVNRDNPVPGRSGCMCGADRFHLVHRYDSAPNGETPFPLPAGHAYRREIFRCDRCGHFVSVHDMVGGDFYAGEYVDATYGDMERMRQTFTRIIRLPEGESDNRGRVRRVLSYATGHFGDAAPHTILDVGSGLCVFLHEMKAVGWTCTAVDPDPRAARHAEETVEAEAICADFRTVEDLPRFDVITFNKVLEHVVDPIEMLKRSALFVQPKGFVYVELPDGEAACDEGFGREEFFFEHYHVFSLASAALLAERAGFHVSAMERVREPSTKYTIRAFLIPNSARWKDEGTNQ